jgi:YHS domain-containing protein
MKNLLRSLVIVMMLPLATWAQKSAVYAEKGIALHGYDPVAFFINKEARKGDSTINFNWKGANWYFESRQNAKLFADNPFQYAPQYGGYCAFGASRGYKAPTAIDTWTIADGKLYFNYNQKVKTVWVKDQAAFINKADSNWAVIKDKE